MDENELSPEAIKELFEIIQKNGYVKLDKIELEDSHDSIAYQSMIKMPTIDITYNDIKWIYYEYQREDVVNKIISNCIKIHLPIFDYVCNIVLNENYKKRDKVVLIIAHMEKCIFQCLVADKGNRGIVKNVEQIISKGDDNKVTNANYARIYLMGIVKVLYANTNNFKKEIDQRIPYRNHILHNGIVDYSNQDIEDLYYILICFFAKLTECELIFQFERKMKKIDEKKEKRITVL